ncbi:MAG: T9SS type A sorting domain-containing protein [Bacteroidota bacterium]
MKKILLLLLVSFTIGANAQNSCGNPYSLCTSFSYPATVGTSSGPGASYGCLSSTPNPTWFYTQVTTAGTLQYGISSTNNLDADFICFGPFSVMNLACVQIDTSNIVDCSFSPNVVDTCTIPGAVVGAYYLIMVTNFTNQAGIITIQSLPSIGSACAHFEGIRGTVFNDNNANCVYEPTDSFLRNIPVEEYDNLGNFLGLSYQSSYGSVKMPYRFYNDTGAYTLKIDTTNMPFVAQCMYPGLDSLVTLTTAMPLDTNVNFNITCKPGFDLAAHSIYRSGWVFPGMSHTVRVTAGNMVQQFYNLNCSTNVGGQVIINLSGPVAYLSTLSTIQPTSVLGNSITYNIADFSTVDIYDDFWIAVTTNTNATIGDTVCVDVSVIAAGDNNLANNQKHYCYPVTNSYDPNMKETYPENVMPGYNDWFYYTIHFQNTGNAQAHNIALTDTLSNQLDVSTFERINYSHDNTTTLSGSVLQFNFNSINLPDSTSNSSGSKGYVQYRVKPKTNLAAGTVINNTAYIYFDYNAPIVTNTSHNTYMMITGIKENVNNEFALFPNPTTGMITITSKILVTAMNIAVYNVVGDMVHENKTTQSKTQLDLSYLSNGVYFVKVSLAKGKAATYKLVIQK